MRDAHSHDQSTKLCCSGLIPLARCLMVTHPNRLHASCSAISGQAQPACAGAHKAATAQSVLSSQDNKVSDRNYGLATSAKCFSGEGAAGFTENSGITFAADLGIVKGQGLVHQPCCCLAANVVAQILHDDSHPSIIWLPFFVQQLRNFGFGL